MTKALPANLHIVDELIYERAPRLVASPLWWMAKPILYAILGYGKAVDLANGVRDLGGHEALEYVSKRLRLEVEITALNQLPAKGRCVVICNHPTGIADGIAVYDAIAKVRNDAIFFANADALRVAPRLGEALIPVEWVEAKRTREKTRATLIAAKDAFEAERCVVLFPAGRLARRGPDGALIDPPWATTAVSLAQKYQAPIIPAHLAGPDSFWFHLFDRFSVELRDITLFHEFLNKAGKRFDLRFGPLITGRDLQTPTPHLNEVLKAFIEHDLATAPEAQIRLSAPDSQH